LHEAGVEEKDVNTGCVLIQDGRHARSRMRLHGRSSEAESKDQTQQQRATSKEQRMPPKFQRDASHLLQTLHGRIPDQLAPNSSRAHYAIA
jgi:hypothetical protein